MSSRKTRALHVVDDTATAEPGDPDPDDFNYFDYREAMAPGLWMGYSEADMD